jgi:heme/copper-type cytochrome/quinol oxidase subunit 3
VTEHSAHVGRRFLDVSGLPKFAFSYHDPIWWGVWMLIAIEATMFALLGSAYSYLRGNASEWPPPGAENAPGWLTASTLLALLASSVPLYWVYRAAYAGALRTLQRGMLLTTLLSIAATALRGYEISQIGYQWNSHAYGSIVWAIYFMHTLHLAAGTIENGVLTSLLFKGPVEKKLMPDVHVSSIYWWFVAASWLVFWPILFLDGLAR